MHPDIAVLLSYIDGDLSDTQARRIAEHLENCGECRSETDYLRASTLPVATLQTEPPEVLAVIRRWAADQAKHNHDGKDRVASAIGPYLGESGSATVLAEVSEVRQNLLPAVEGVLSDFLGRRAVGQLVDHIVEHAIMRS